MRIERRTIRILSVLVLAAVILCGFAGCGEQGEQQRTDIEDYADAKLGTFAGSPSETVTEREFPHAERIYFTSLSDLTLALKLNKIDGFILDKVFYYGISWENDDLTYLDRTLERLDYTYIFSRNERGAVLKEQMDEFIAAREADGTLERLREKWFSGSEPDGQIDLSGFTGENGVISLAIGTDNKPFVYRKNNQYTGYEIEIAAMFAREYGYAYEITEVNFDGAMFGVETGRYDMGAYAINPTSEREQAMLFSAPTVTGEMVLIVCSEDGGNAGFFERFREGFEKTFIREDRWQLILKGIGVTLVISVFSAVLGSLLGFLLYLLSRSPGRVIGSAARGVGRVYSRIVAGTPIVVILMILFYVVFAAYRNMSGVVVAIIGFALVFGAFVYNHMTVSANSVDRGQIEAAYALGYSRNRTFFRIVFPQAMTIFLPSYCGEVVALVKATAVVGYIAVNDLTRMGDIIRSNTYEAFFPLMATAVIYFILTWVIASLLKLVRFRFEPKRRSRETILRGIDPQSV